MTDQDLIDELVALHGEGYRKMLTDALAWLGTREPDWDLDEPIDRREYAEGLISKSAPRTNS